MPKGKPGHRRQRSIKHDAGWTFQFFDHVRQEWRAITVPPQSYEAARTAFRRILREERQETRP